MKRLILPIILVILLCLPGIWDLFQPNYFTSHDGEGHVIRMDEFYHAFRDGQLPVRWSKRLYFGYGYPFFNFNYPAAYYFGVPIMYLGFSAMTAMKTELVSMYLISGVVMFLYLRRKVSWPFAVVGAVLYCYAPYRFVNIYVRGSVAESSAFLFPPLLLWAAELIAERKHKSILLSAVILFLLGISHNISALLLFAFFFLYMIFLSIRARTIRPFLAALAAFIGGLMMAAFFFVPALLEKKYTFLDQTIAKDYPDHFVYLSQLIKGGWGFGSSIAGPNDGLSFNIGWLQLGIAVLGSAWLLLRQKLKSKKFLFGFSLTMLAISVFFMLSPSKIFWDHLPLLPFVQFPWRFLLLTVPVLAVVSALVLHQLAKMFVWSKIVKILVALAIISGALFLAKDEWHINQVLVPKTIVGDALLGTTTWADEQATHWFIPKPTSVPAQKIEFASGLGQFQIQSWLTGKHTYTLEVSVATTVVENTMYYPGWQVMVDGHPAVIDFQNKNYPGRIVYTIETGQHHIVSSFRETPLRLAMDLLSAATALGVGLALIWPRYKKNAPQTTP